MNNTIKRKIHISELKSGMTIEINGNFETVSKKFLKFCPFMGYSYKGDSSTKYLNRIMFKVPVKDGYRYE